MMNKHFMSRFLAFKAILVLLFTARCDIGDSLDHGIDQVRLFREQSVFEINTASNQIAGGIGNIKDVLDNLNQKLPEEIHKTLSFDVPFIIDAIAGEGISAGLCFTDAAASKALYLLELMKSEIITGEPVPLPDPFICTTSIPAINLNQDKNQRDIAKFTGYNLFLNRDFNAAIFNAAGDSIPVPSTRPSNYQVTVNLSDFDDNTLEKFKYMSLYYQGQPISSLFVIRKHETPPVTKFASPRPVPGMMAAYPRATTPSNHFGADCNVAASIAFGNTRKRAWVDMTLIVQDLSGGGRTYAIGRADRNYYYTAPPGWHIKKLEGQNAYDYHSYKDVTNEDDVRYTLFGQLTVKARNSIAGSTTSGVLNFGTNVPDVVLESGD